MKSPTLDALERVFLHTLSNLRFREVARHEPGIFDDGFVVYERGGVEIRLVSDRGHPTVDVGSVRIPNEWYDLALVRSHVQNRDILESPKPDELASFLARADALLSEMFTAKLLETVKVMKSLEQERAERVLSKLLDEPDLVPQDYHRDN